MKIVAAVVGTDTNVGKTCAARTIIEHYLSRDIKVRGIKPFVSGSENEIWSDPIILDPENKFITPARYNLPLSPYAAILRGEKKIEINSVREYISKSSENVEMIIVEGIGGVMVPLDDKNLWIDIHREYKWPALIICHSGLGTINHTLLTIEALRRRDISIIGIILNNNNKECEIDFVKENADIISRIASVEVLGIIEYNEADWKRTWKMGINWEQLEKKIAES